MRMSRGAAAIAATALGLGLACGERHPTGPVAGTLRVTVSMPAGNAGFDRAILFRLTAAAPPTASTASAGFQVFRQPLTTVTTFAVTGTLTPGAELLRLDVPDVRQTYTATVVQVAASDYQLRALVGYGVNVVP